MAFTQDSSWVADRGEARQGQPRETEQIWPRRHFQPCIPTDLVVRTLSLQTSGMVRTPELSISETWSGVGWLVTPFPPLWAAVMTAKRAHSAINTSLVMKTEE